MAEADEPCAVDALLAEARAHLVRVTAPELAGVMARGGLVVDIRPVEQRQRDGDLPGAVVIDRNVLEWRLDPTSPHRLTNAGDADRVVVVVCNEGFSSSLAAATLRRLGLARATDLVGGFQAWRAHVPTPRAALRDYVAETHSAG
jgi:rhodanese-related sulfurtransferase